MVSDGCVGADAGCWADGAAVSDDGGASYGGPAVDEGAAAHPDVVRYGCGLFDGSVVIGVEVVADELISLQQVLRLPRVFSPALYPLGLDSGSCGEEGLDGVCDLQFSSP